MFRMTISITRYLLGTLVMSAAVAFAQGTTPSPVAAVTNSAVPRQVILIIGDGMDEQQITIARNYLRGAAGQLLLDRMPLRSAVQIQTNDDSIDGKPVYVADSANTASTMATGIITSIGRISTGAGTNEDLTTITELAARAGLRTGIVTTASVTDATPAAFATHISMRLCENSERMADINYHGIPLGDCKGDMKANGGKGSIAEQLAESSLDVILGGGTDHFSPLAEGATVSIEELARRHGFAVVTDTRQLEKAPLDKKLLGLFAPGTLPVRWQGDGGRAAEAPKRSWLNHLHPYLGGVTLPAPMTCVPNPEFSNTPTLPQMTEVALDHLSHANAKGFFLMVESASIDKQSHERKPCGSIGEVKQLEEALAVALAFADSHPNTLIMVTADHSQAAQLVPDESLFAAYPIPIFTPGQLARIVTPEGSHMAVNYATNNFDMEEHTGAAVPLYSNMEGVERIGPFLQQAQIFTITRDYLGL
jgi:alkaline phosphatase